VADGEPNIIRLQVANARPEDSGHGIARLPRTSMVALGLAEGDVVSLEGKRTTAARAVLPYAEDEGLELVRLDGLLRINAGVGTGEPVSIRKAESKPAQRVVFAPAQQNLRLHGSGEALKRSFAGRPLTAGDIVATAGQQQVDRTDMPPQLRQMLAAPAYALQEIRLSVVATSPKGVVHIDANTEVELRTEYEAPGDARRADVTYDDIGGMGDTIDQLREMVELPLRYPELFERLGVDPPKGVLLYGPPGTGKTLLAKAVAREAEANFISTRSSDLLSKWYGESEQQISRLFARARQVAPCVIFIDEMDSLVPARGGGMGEPQVTERVVNTILAEMDGIEDLQSVVVIGATNRPNLIDPALMRPGRLDELIYVTVPDQAGRLHILKIHTGKMPLGSDVDLAALAARTDKFTGADLEDLTRRAGLAALRESLSVETVTMKHFEAALKETRASVTPEMERDYANIQNTLKTDAYRPASIGFVAPGMLTAKGEKA
jgi:transitional endoplasmic reticulum ATPase